MDLHRVGIRLGAEARLVLTTLHVTNAWHPSSGGIGTFYRALLDTANSIGWQARLVVPSHDTHFEPVGSHAGIYHVKAPHAPVNTAYRILYPHRYLLPGSPLRHILRIEQPHVVEVNDKYSLPYLAGLLRLGAHGPSLCGRDNPNPRRSSRTFAAHARGSGDCGPSRMATGL